MKKYIILGSLLVTLFSFTQVFADCDQAAVEQTNQKWAQALNTDDPNTVASFYSQDAILLATYENAPITTREGKIAYFTKLFSQFKPLTVHYDKTFIRILDGAAISSGLYTFVGTDKQGKQVSIPARFVFVYKATDAGCKLIVHHSSAMPNV